MAEQEEAITVVVKDNLQESPKNTKMVSAWKDLKSSAYWKLYQTLPWYIMSYLIIFIVIYNACYPSHKKLSYLQIDTQHVEQAWRIYTHAFLHADAVHLTSNCITIFCLTLMLGTAHHKQQWRIMILYTLAILHGTCGIGWEKRLVYPSQRFRAIGASGSAYGLLGMNTSDLVLNWSGMPLRWFRLFILSFFIAFELVAWYYLYSDSVSVSGHLGGFLGGVIGAPCLLIDASHPHHEDVGLLRIVMSSVLYASYTIAGLVNYFTFAASSS